MKTKFTSLFLIVLGLILAAAPSVRSQDKDQKPDPRQQLEEELKKQEELRKEVEVHVYLKLNVLSVIPMTVESVMNDPHHEFIVREETHATRFISSCLESLPEAPDETVKPDLRIVVTSGTHKIGFSQSGEVLVVNGKPMKATPKSQAWFKTYISPLIKTLDGYQAAHEKREAAAKKSK